MKVLKCISAEVEVEIGIDDVTDAMEEAFSRVTRNNEGCSRVDVLFAIDAIARFMRALKDEHIAMLTPEQRHIIDMFLNEQVVRF